MSQQKSQSGSNPLTMHSEQHVDHFDMADATLSPQSSTCVRSTDSQDALLTRSDLIGIMNHVSVFARHYSAAYYGIGCSYHELPYSARESKWIVSGMREVATQALTAWHYKQLPDLVTVFGEVSLRLRESQVLLSDPGKDWQAAEMLLRRCDALLQEAEIRVRFLEVAVWNMWVAVEHDESVAWDEGEVLEEGRATLRREWLSVLPQICFVVEGMGEAQREHER